MRDVSQRFERSAGRFLVPGIDRQKLNVPAAWQVGIAARDADHIPARGKKLLDRGNTQQAACASDQHLVRHDADFLFSSRALSNPFLILQLVAVISSLFLDSGSLHRSCEQVTCQTRYAFPSVGKFYRTSWTIGPPAVWDRQFASPGQLPLRGLPGSVARPKTEPGVRPINLGARGSRAAFKGAKLRTRPICSKRLSCLAEVNEWKRSYNGRPHGLALKS